MTELGRFLTVEY